MNRETLTDATEYIDANAINEYVQLKSCLSCKERSARIIWSKKLIAAVICVALIVPIITVVLILNLSDKVIPGGIFGQNPGIENYAFKLGETCSSTTSQYPDSEITVNDVVITNIIGENHGYYIVFYADIKTENYSIVTEDITQHGNSDTLRVSFSMLKWWEDPRANDSFSLFEKELSQSLSEAQLIIDDRPGEMNGKIALVFSIDELSFGMIKSKTGESAYQNLTGKYAGVQYCLETNISWYKHVDAHFVFYTTDASYVESIS